MEKWSVVALEEKGSKVFVLTRCVIYHWLLLIAYNNVVVFKFFIYIYNQPR